MPTERSHFKGSYRLVVGKMASILVMLAEWNLVQKHDDMRPVTTTGTELMATRNVMLEQMKDMRLGRTHLQQTPAWLDLAEPTHGC